MLASCNKKDSSFEKVLEKLSSVHVKADLQVENFSIEQLSQDQSEWFVQGKHAYVLHREGKTYIESIQVVYHTSANETTTVTANEGTVLEHERKIILQDDVVIQTNTGKTLRSEELIWDEQAKQIYTEKEVTLTYGNGDILHGKNGLRASQNLERIELFSGRGIHKTKSP